MTLRWMVWPLLTVAVGIALGGVAQYLRDHSSLVEANVYRDRKMTSLRQQAEKAPQGLVLLVGDSITERAWVPTLCGMPAFNAGVSAARVQDMIGLAQALDEKLRPSTIVVTLGTNDAGWGKTPLADFTRAYEHLLAALHTPNLILVGIPPIEPGKYLSKVVDVAAITAENGEIARLAAEHRAAFVAPLSTMPTEDGIHPTPPGSIAWRASIEARCNVQTSPEPKDRNL